MILDVPFVENTPEAIEQMKQNVYAALQDAFNENTIIDLYEGTRASDSPQWISHTLSAFYSSPVIQKPLFQATIKRWIQAGANSMQGMNIIYDSMRIVTLGMDDTNVLTHSAAENAINEVQAAEKIVSEQRSLFGAWQNRFLHAQADDDISAENLQASESKIRDTDVAKEMVIHAAKEILIQTGQAMLSQTNNITMGVLQLLR